VIGDLLATRYRLEAPLGAGGSAVVYRAHDIRLDRDVALKLLLPNLAQDPVIAVRFEREARALAAISDPGIVSIFDVEPGDPVSGREPFFVMELCPDGSLADELVKVGGRLPPETVVRIIGDVAGGLGALHARGLIHRDVKPHNILLTQRGAKLADFGVVRAADTSQFTAQFTAPGTAIGTLAYLAPELLSGAAASPASDVYSLGVTAFQALTGRLPRPSNSIAELADARQVPPLRLSAVAPDLAAFDSPLAASMLIDPNERPTARQFAASLTAELRTWPMAPGPRADGGDEKRQRSAPRPVPPANSAVSDARTVAVKIPGRSAAGSVRRRGVIGALAILAVAAILGTALFAGGGFFSVTPGTSRQPVASQSLSPSPPLSPSLSPTGSASQGPSAGASPSASANPFPTLTPTLSQPTPATGPPTPIVAFPTPSLVTPLPTVIPTLIPIYDAAQARQDLSNVMSSIDNAVALGQIRSGDATMLRSEAATVDKRLTNNDPNGARIAADQLLATINQLIGEGRLQSGGELRTWAQMLQQVLPEH